MRITEVSKMTGASPDEIRYFETKGYISSSRILLKLREVRDYTESDVRLIKVLTKYRREGFQLGPAHERAIREIQQPYLVQ